MCTVVLLDPGQMSGSFRVDAGNWKHQLLTTPPFSSSMLQYVN